MTTERETFVWVSIAVTVTPGTGAPCASWTVPSSVPRTAWAKAVPERALTDTASSASRTSVRFVMVASRGVYL